jgi:hypothetical protein
VLSSVVVAPAVGVVVYPSISAYPRAPYSANGPSVTPLILAYTPAVVVHTSPSVGVVGAAPCGSTRWIGSVAKGNVSRRHVK